MNDFRVNKWIREKRSEGCDWDHILYGESKNYDDLEMNVKMLNTYVFMNNKITIESFVKAVEFVRDIDERAEDVTFVDALVTNGDKDNDCKLLNSNTSAWYCYKESLEKNNFSINTIETIEKTTFRILKRLKSDTSPENPNLGLVVGNVQSGKTTNMAALMCMAADNGFNFFIVLSGTIENLRQQTQDRLTSDLKIDNSKINFHHITNPKTGIQSTQLSELHVQKNSDSRYFSVCLKNSQRLKNFLAWLKRDDTTRKMLNILIIDDEADQAGINTYKISKEERSAINKCVVNLTYGNDENSNPYKTPFKALNYIGYTATPYANILNESPNIKGSLFPKDFVAVLEQSKEYFGPQRIFGDNGLNIINRIKEDDISTIRLISRNDSLLDIPNSMKEAILWFYCCVACFRFWREDKPISMLIHTSQLTTAHRAITENISKWLSSTNNDDFIQLTKSVYENQTKMISLNEFWNTFSDYSGDNVRDYPNFDDLKSFIEEIRKTELTHIKMDNDKELEYSKGIHLCVDNCSYTSKDSNEHVRLAYPKEKQGFATAFIVIGGATLSRGLTIEGLVSTYFLRTTKQADTLMQMGRWFGYRKGYELLPRLWLSKKTIKQFRFLSDLDSDLRREMTLLDSQNATPADCGIKVRNTPKAAFITITSKNKMQSAEATDFDFTGAISQVTSFYNNLTSIKNNISHTEKFIENIKSTSIYSMKRQAHIFKGIDHNIIFDYLEKMEYPEMSSRVSHLDCLRKWFDETVKDNKMGKFNVLIAGVKTTSFRDLAGLNIATVERSKKVKDVYNEEGIINIGALRNASDLIFDVNLEKLTEEELISSKNLNVDIISQLRASQNLNKTPQLILYVIDKNSKPKTTDENRASLELEDDLIGYFLSVPGGNKGSNYATSLKVKITPKEFEGDIDVYDEDQ